MSSLDRAVKKTVAYSAFFNFYLYPEEVHRWLISPKPVSLDSVCKLCVSPIPPSAASLRNKRSRFSLEKLAKAKKIARLLSIIPTIHLIAVTGSVAVGNAKKLDDVDLLIITSDHSLWLTRPLVLFLLSLFSHRRRPGQDYHKAAHSFCPNLWLEHRSLAVPEAKRNLYTAHEVLFVTPIFDRSATHHRFLLQNTWVKKYLANAYLSATSPAKNISGSSNILTLFLLPLNLLSYSLQHLYMRPRITTEDVSLASAYFHTHDFADKINKHLAKV